MEDELDGIADGKPWVPVIDEFYQQFATNLAKADGASKLDIRKEPELVGRDCPQSGHRWIYREGRYGRFIGLQPTIPTAATLEQILGEVGVTCRSVAVI